MRFLISTQLCGQRSFVWSTVQPIGKARLLGRLYQSGLGDFALSHRLLTCFQVAGHVGDEHRCSALVHMCGEVRLNSAVLLTHLITVTRFSSLVPSRI